MADLLPEEEVTKKTYDNQATTWVNNVGASGFWLPQLERFCHLLPAGRILEIGAGGGRDAETFVKKGYEYVGTDISGGILEIARKKLPGQTFYTQNVTELSIPGGKFDGFWACDVLLHIPKSKIDEALQKIKGHLKPKAIGFISLKDGTAQGVQNDAIGGENFQRFFSYWGRDEFIDVLWTNGFSLVEYSDVWLQETHWHMFFVKAD